MTGFFWPSTPESCIRVLTTRKGLQATLEIRAPTVATVTLLAKLSSPFSFFFRNPLACMFEKKPRRIPFEIVTKNNVGDSPFSKFFDVRFSASRKFWRFVFLLFASSSTTIIFARRTSNGLVKTAARPDFKHKLNQIFIVWKLNSLIKKSKINLRPKVRLRFPSAFLAYETFRVPGTCENLELFRFDFALLWSESSVSRKEQLHN